MGLFRSPFGRVAGICAVLLLGVSGCGRSDQDESPPAVVSVLSVRPSVAAVMDELPGRVSAVRVAEIRAQVSGIVVRRLFDQGTEVKAGQPLYQVNPAPFKAESDIAQASLRRAEAEQAKSSAQAARFERLMQANAVSRQAYDDAMAARDQASADVAQARATLARRRLDLKFSTVDSPISGRIEQAMVSEGALVGSADANPMARVQQIDQVYVDVRMPTSALGSLRNAFSSTGSSSQGELVATILRDGEDASAIRGRILFSGVSVDAGTGDVLVRVLVDNKDRLLLPGMFVRARIPRATYQSALLVPQQAVTFTNKGTFVWVLDEKSQAHAVAVKLGEVVDRKYRVASGLRAGQKVVVEGGDRLSEGAAVDATPWSGPRAVLDLKP